MYCKKCGAELVEDSIFCHQCGASNDDENNIINEQPKQSPKIWNIFAKIGYIGGIICFIVSFIPYFSLYASGMAIDFIVLSALGKKSTIPEYYKKAKKGLGFSIAGTIIGIVIYILFIAIIIMVSNA